MNGKRKGWFKKKGGVVYAGRWDGLDVSDYIQVDLPPTETTIHFYEMMIDLSRVVSGSQYFVGLNTPAGGIMGIRYNGSTLLYYDGSVIDTLSYTAVSGFVKLRIERVSATITWKINDSIIGTTTTGISSATSFNLLGKRGTSVGTTPFNGDIYDFNYNDEIFITDPSNGNAVDSVGGYALTEFGEILQITV